MTTETAKIYDFAAFKIIYDEIKQEAAQQIKYVPLYVAYFPLLVQNQPQVTTQVQNHNNVVALSSYRH